MSTVLEITQLTNGDVVLRDADEEGEPLLRIRFSEEVKDMLGDDLVEVAEAMIEAATDFLESESAGGEGCDEDEELLPARPPVVH